MSCSHTEGNICPSTEPPAANVQFILKRLPLLCFITNSDLQIIIHILNVTNMITQGNAWDKWGHYHSFKHICHFPPFFSVPEENIDLGFLCNYPLESKPGLLFVGSHKCLVLCNFAPHRFPSSEKNNLLFNEERTICKWLRDRERISHSLHAVYSQIVCRGSPAITAALNGLQFIPTHYSSTNQPAKLSTADFTVTDFS